MNKKFLSLLLLAFPMLSFAQELTMDEIIEAKFKPFADAVSFVVFYPVSIVGIDVPIVVIILLLGALFFTLYFKFANIRLLGVAIKATNGKYDDIDHNSKDDISEEDVAGSDGDEVIQIKGVVGEVTHFQALTAALSATVGLGNIAGVAVAIAIGGPGATVWMILAGFLGMSTKLVEATLGVKYREVGPDGKIYGGPMYYLKKRPKRKEFRRVRESISRLICCFCNWRFFWRWKYVSI